MYRHIYVKDGWLHTCTCMYISTCIHVHPREFMCVYTNAHMYTHIHIAGTNAHTHTHTHTHTHIT